MERNKIIQASPTARRPDVTSGVTRGVRRYFARAGMVTTTELVLATGRRADVVALDSGGILTIVEIKSCVDDFRTDCKWAEYGPFCDRFFFAIPDDFPQDLIPDACGLMVADRYEAAILRDAPVARLNPARRRAMLLRFAHTAAGRLLRIEDPEL